MLGVELKSEEDWKAEVPALPPNHGLQSKITTPRKDPQINSLTPFNKSNNSCADPFPNLSPYIVKSRSPFTPFCKENLSPLENIDGSFMLKNSKRILFTSW